MVDFGGTFTLPGQSGGMVGGNQYGGGQMPSWMRSPMTTGGAGRQTGGSGSGPLRPPTMPGMVPSQGSGMPSPGGPFYGGAHGGPIIGGGDFSVEQSMDPALTSQLFQYLQSQVGKGVTPFNLSTALPFGGKTGKGQVNASANPLLMQLMSFFTGKGGGGMPGADTLSTIANQGISALPEWQSMIQAQHQNIQQNEANLKEQFGFMGGLAGTPFGNAMSNYESQTTADQNALLGQLQQQNILQGQLPAAEFLQSQGQQFGQYAQGVNQQAIQNLMNEFIRSSPQYNPLLGLEFGGATSFMPVLNRSGQQGQGAFGGLMSSIGPMLQMMMAAAPMGA